MAKNKTAGSPFAALEVVKKRLEAEEQERIARKGKPAPQSQALPSAQPKFKAPKQSAADDEVTFHRLMSGVAPLDTGGKQRVPVSSQATPGNLTERRAAVAARAQQEEDEVHAQLDGLVAGALRFEVTDDGAHLEGRRSDVRPDAVRKLRHGQFPIDARLDLHGLRAQEAKDKLVDFLRVASSRGERCVLVIHGKGEHSPFGVGVLRGEIAAWLSQGRGSHVVLAFASAQEPDGGSGATYVLLGRG